MVVGFVGGAVVAVERVVGVVVVVVVVKDG